MRSAIAALVLLLSWLPAVAQETPPRPGTPEQAAQEVLAAWQGKNEAALQALAKKSRPDPWLVADELCRRKAHDAAEAFAGAAPRKAVESLPAYVTSRRGQPADEAAFRGVQAATAALGSGDLAGALAALPTEVQAGTVIGAQVAYLRGVVLRAQGHETESTAAYLASAERAESLGWLDRAGRAFDAAGRLENAQGHRERALELFERGLADMEAIEFSTGVAAILVNIGIVYQDQMQFFLALRYYERALRPMEKSGHDRGLAATLHRIGVASTETGNYPQALGAYQRVLPIRVRMGDRAGWSGAQINMGNVYHSLANYPKALTHYELGLKVAVELRHTTWIANAKNGLAGVYRAIGDHARALELAEQVLELRRADGDARGLALALHNLGMLYQELGRLTEALDFYTRALESARVIGMKSIESQALSGAARIHLANGRFTDALAGYEDALEVAELTEDPALVAWCRAGVGVSQVGLGERKAGIATLKRAERDGRRLRERSLLVWSLGKLAALYLDDGDAARAMSLAREARAEVEQLLGGLGAESASSLRERHAGLFATGALAAARLGDIAEAVAFLESGRAGALLEQLGGGNSLRWADVPEDLRQEELGAKRVEANAREEFRRALAEGGREEVREKSRELDQAQTRVRTAVAKIQREAKGQTADLFYPRASTVEEIQEHLELDQALVLYAFCRGETIAVVLTRDEGRVVSLGPMAEIRTACDALELRNPGVDPVGPLARLRDALVTPLQLPTETRQVLVSPEGPICYVPLGALFPQSVAFTPSGTTHALLGDQLRDVGTGVLALGDPAYEAADERGRSVYVRGGALTPLPATRSEARAIGDEVLLGAEANERTLRTRLAEKVRWRAVHFACHGLVDRERPTLSSLALSPTEGEDGFLTALEVLRMDLPADLAVLSACETGTDRNVPGEGIVGLTRAFMYAGTPSVLCSLWRVDDEATRALMVKFYALWNPKKGEGLPAATALKRAQEHVRSQEQWRHPYYWAAWVLWGLPD